MYHLNLKFSSPLTTFYLPRVVQSVQYCYFSTHCIFLQTKDFLSTETRKNLLIHGLRAVGRFLKDYFHHFKGLSHKGTVSIHEFFLKGM